LGLGLWKSLRYWVRKYPTFIVNGKKKHTGWDKDALECVLQRAKLIQHQQGERGKNT